MREILDTTTTTAEILASTNFETMFLILKCPKILNKYFNVCKFVNLFCLSSLCCYIFKMHYDKICIFCTFSFKLFYFLSNNNKNHISIYNYVPRITTPQHITMDHYRSVKTRVKLKIKKYNKRI